MVQPVLRRRPVPESPSGADAPIGRRGAARLRLAIPARLILTSATGPCVLLDLSNTGAQVALAGPLAPGTPLFLKVAQIEVFGEIVRSHRGEGGGVIGVRFDEPLSDAEVLAVRRHADTYETRERQALRDKVRRWVRGEGRL